MPGAGLTHLTVVQGADSYVHFLGRRERTGADGTRRVDVVHAIQYQTGLAVTDWRSLGNPHPDREQGLLLGPPVGAVAADGSVHVFARGAHGGLVLRREAANGKWRAWEELPGAGISPWPAPVALSGGRIEVCADAETGVFVWRQLEAGGDFTGPRGFALRAAPGTVAGVETGPEQATFFWTDADHGTAVSWRAGGWPTPLGGSRRSGRTRRCARRSTATTVSSSPIGTPTATRCSAWAAPGTRATACGGTRSPSPARAHPHWPGTATAGSSWR